MDTVPLSDVQIANLSMLVTIKDSIQQDPASACCKFGLRSDELSALSGLSMDRMLAIVANMGQQSLFPPRGDLGMLLNVPLPLSGLMASARPMRRAACDTFAAA
jgi:hypothetical protein